MKPELEEAYRRACLGGKRRFAAFMDAFVFTLCFGAAVLALVYSVLRDARASAFIAVVCALAALIVLEAHGRRRFASQIAALNKAVADELLRQKLLLADSKKLLSIVRSEAEATDGSNIRLFQTSAPVSPDAVFSVMREEQDDVGKPIGLYSVSALSEEGRNAIEALNNAGSRIVFHMLSEIEGIGKRFPVSEGEIERRILSRFGAEQKKTINIKKMLHSMRAAKFLVLGILLFAASFIMRFGHFLRAVALVSFTASVYSPLLRRAAAGQSGRRSDQ